MLDLFPLPIFPVDSASVTLTTTVWIGVIVAVLFNLKLGWNLSAMVVPGYLVPLLLSRPTMAVVIFIEAIVTYCLARLLSDACRRMPWWSSFFGRDRFFIIVVISVIVRLSFDGFLLPEIGKYIVNEIGWNFDYRNDLQSFGLIVVALIANYFWKPGFIRGIFPIATCIATTFVLIYFGLGLLTNLNLTNFNLMYEDISASVLASPKSYILLICTAYLASWINLRYAWDFNGILIPALLGMMLYDPLKIVASCAECLLIYSIASLLMRAPLIREISLQGGRKLLFFFTICFCLRLSYAHLIPLFSSAGQVTDVFGLGYLLSTLMAVKAHDKQLMIRMLKGTLQVSLVGGIAGSLIGFMLYSWSGNLFSSSMAAVAMHTHPDTAVVAQSLHGIDKLIRQSKPLLYEKQEEGSYQPPAWSELEIFSSAMQDIKRLVTADDTTALTAIARKLALVNYNVTVSADNKLFLVENEPARGWGMYAISPEDSSGLCIEVPTPLDEWATVESGVGLMGNFPTYALAIAGASQSTNVDGTADVTRYRATIFTRFHEVFGEKQTVQIRAMTGPLWRSLKGDNSVDRSNITSQVYVKSSLPQSMPLELLQETIGAFELQWSQSPYENRNAKSEQYVELLLTKQVRRRMLVLSQTPTQKPPSAAGKGNIGNSKFTPASEVAIVRKPLAAFLSEVKEKIQTQGSEEFVQAKLEEMLFMDKEVVGPLIELVGETFPDRSFQPSSANYPQWFDREIFERLQAIQSAAHITGYQISIVLDPDNGDQFFALSESSEQNKGWGTFLFRPAIMEDIAVEIPRPLFESRSFDFGVSLFQRPRASVLLIAGAHPRANQDGSADISKAANRRNLFNLVRQVLFRKLGDRPYLLCQARAIQAPVDSDIVLASDEGEISITELSPLKQKFAQQLVGDKFSVGFVDGSPKTAGYELGILMKAASSQVAQNKEVMSLWLSPSLRSKYRQQNEHSTLLAEMNACDIDVVIGNLIEQIMLLKDQHRDGQSFQVTSELPSELPSELKEGLNAYVENLDVIKLLAIKQRLQQWTLRCVLDNSSGQNFLIVIAPNRQPVAVINLTGHISKETFELPRLDRGRIRKFIDSRKLWLEVQRR